MSGTVGWQEWLARTVDERLVLKHYRGEPHNEAECPTCGALAAREAYGYARAIDSIASGE